jgi:hypothetical protein
MWVRGERYLLQMLQILQMHRTEELSHHLLLMQMTEWTERKEIRGDA